MFSIRPMKESDFQNVCTAVKDQWFSEYDLPEELLLAASEEYANRYLRDATHAYVCDNEGEFAGFLLGRGDGLGKMFGDVPVSDNLNIPEKFLNMLRDVISADERMLERCSQQGFDSELLLFITLPSVRGTGAGTALLDTFVSDLISSGHRKMYLFTDEYCNMGYYERKGCRLAAKESVFLEGKDRVFVMLSLGLLDYAGGKFRARGLHRYPRPQVIQRMAGTEPRHREGMPAGPQTRQTFRY